MQTTTKYDFIDALRGWAILGVVLVHATQAFAPSSEWLARISREGARGVQLFYLVSAFTLFLSFRSRFTKERKPILNFFIRRFFRIAPLFYVAILSYTALNGFQPRYWAPFGISWEHVIATIFFLNGWHPEFINSVVPGGWSIAVEMNFYILIPFLFRLVTTWKRAIALTLLSLVVSAAASKVFFPVYKSIYPHEFEYLAQSFTNSLWLPYQAPTFSLGIVLYFFFTKKEVLFNSMIRSNLNAAANFLLLVTLIYLVSLTMELSILPFPRQFSFGLCFLTISSALAVSPNNILVNKPIIAIGKKSYCMYLAHFLVIAFLQKYYTQFTPNVSPDVSSMTFFLATASVTYLISIATSSVIEKPGIALGSRIIDYFESSRREHDIESIPLQGGRPAGVRASTRAG